MNDDPNDNQRDWRAKYGLPPRAPRDVVSTAITVEALRKLDEMVGQSVEIVEPGEIPLDPDGVPLAVGPSTTTQETIVGPIIRAAEFLRLGADPADYPNITCHDPRNLLTTNEED